MFKAILATLPTEYPEHLIQYKEADDHLWTVIAPHPLTYAINGKLVTKRRGPAPDSTMRPIRGIAARADINVENLKQEISTED